MTPRHSHHDLNPKNNNPGMSMKWKRPNKAKSPGLLAIRAGTLFLIVSWVYLHHYTVNFFSSVTNPEIHQNDGKKIGVGLKSSRSGSDRKLQYDDVSQDSALIFDKAPIHQDKNTVTLCVLDREVLEYMASKKMIPSFHERGATLASFPLKQRYTSRWDSSDTCWLANQLLVTEALGGYHPYCNRHSQNRNFLYALSTLAGSMNPTTEAVKILGSVLGEKELTDEMIGRSYQLQGMEKEKIASERARILQEVEGPGLSLLPRTMDEAWLDRLTKKLSNCDFTKVSDGWTIKGLNPNAIIEKGWYGTFSLFDLNEALAIEEIQQIAYDPFILSSLQDILGAPPIIRAADIYMNVPKQDGSTTKFEFDTWHKDFNSVRSVKVFVYLTDALQDAYGPHTYIPFTQNVMGPTYVNEESDSYIARDFDSREEYEDLVDSFALSLSSQVLPYEYLKANVYTQETTQLFGKKGLTWIEDTHIFHKAESAKKGWRGLLMIDYTASGFGGKDHVSFHRPLSKMPHTKGTDSTSKDFPRLFQRVHLGEYANPKSNDNTEKIPDKIWEKARRLEERFGPLLYNETVQSHNPRNHKEYVSEGFKDAGNIPKPADDELVGAACWEYDCLKCVKSLNTGGTCGICAELHVCTCTCEHAFSCAKDDEPERKELNIQVQSHDGSGGLIPRRVHQYWYSLDPIPGDEHPTYRFTNRMMKTWKNDLGFEYSVYDDAGAREFLIDNFPSEVVEAYDTLIPGAFKSDLFRIAILLVHGGIYADNDLHPVQEGLNALLEDDNTSFFASIDRKSKENEGKQSNCFLNGLIGSAPGHPILAVALSRIVSQVLNRHTIADISKNLCPNPHLDSLLKLSPLYLSGPCLLGTSANIALGRSPFREFTPGVIGTEDAPLSFPGSMRLIQWDHVKREQKHKLGLEGPNHQGFKDKGVMRRFMIDEEKKVKEVTWSKLSTEVPRSHDPHYSQLKKIVPDLHVFSRGAYKTKKWNSKVATSPWYDFRVNSSSGTYLFSTKQVRARYHE